MRRMCQCKYCQLTVNHSKEGYWFAPLGCNKMVTFTLNHHELNDFIIRLQRDVNYSHISKIKGYIPDLMHGRSVESLQERTTVSNLLASMIFIEPMKGVYGSLTKSSAIAVCEMAASILMVCEEGSSVRFELVIGDFNTVTNIDFERLLNQLAELVVYIPIDDYKHVGPIVKQCVDIFLEPMECITRKLVAATVLT